MSAPRGRLATALMCVLAGGATIAASIAASIIDPTAAEACGHARCETSVFDAVGGGSGQGRWAGQLTIGFPWQRARAQYGLTRRWTPLVELESAQAVRWRPSLGVGLRWLDTVHARITGEVLLGWQFQTTPELRQRGPSGELRVRALFPFGRVAPFLILGTQYTALFDRTRIERATGVDTEYSMRGELTLWGSLGVAVAITRRIGIEIAIDAPWVAVPTITIPGIHVGLTIGGGPYR